MALKTSNRFAKESIRVGFGKCGFCESFICRRKDAYGLVFLEDKTKTEVDFVLEKGLQLLPIEVKTSLAKAEAPQALLSFIEKFISKKP